MQLYGYNAQYYNEREKNNTHNIYNVVLYSIRQTLPTFITLSKYNFLAMRSYGLVLL